MLLAMLAAAMLLTSSEQRLPPDLPTVSRWVETGSRHARRRDQKLARG